MLERAKAPQPRSVATTTAVAVVTASRCATIGEKRSAVLPDVETVGEAVPGFVPRPGMPAPAGAPGSAPAPVPEEKFHFCRPLRMRRAAKAEAVREEAGPVFAAAEIGAFLKTLAPPIVRAFLAVRVMGVAEEPRRERAILVGGRRLARRALILLRLRGEQPLERRARQLARIPRMIRAQLRIGDFGGERERGDEQGNSV